MVRLFVSNDRKTKNHTHTNKHQYKAQNTDDNYVISPQCLDAVGWATGMVISH